MSICFTDGFICGRMLCEVRRPPHNESALHRSAATPTQRTLSAARRRSAVATTAFTLIEVMLALAIVSIGIVAILGLIPNALQSSRDAADNTVMATIAHDVFNAVRTNTFTQVDLRGLGFTGGFPPGPPYNLLNVPPANGNYRGIVAYFDQGGFIATPAAVQNHYFQVNLTFTNQSPLALSVVTATVVWPAQSAAPVNTNVFVTKIAQYYQ